MTRNHGPPPEGIPGGGIRLRDPCAWRAGRQRHHALTRLGGRVVQGTSQVGKDRADEDRRAEAHGHYGPARPARAARTTRAARPAAPPGRGSKALVPLIPAGTSGAPAAAARRAAPRRNPRSGRPGTGSPPGNTITSCPAVSNRAAAVRSALPPPERRTGNAAHSAWQISRPEPAAEPVVRRRRDDRPPPCGQRRDQSGRAQRANCGWPRSSTGRAAARRRRAPAARRSG